MIEIIIIVFIFLLAVIANKGFGGIKDKEVRGIYLIFVGFLIQLIIFNGKFSHSSLNFLTPTFYIISLFVLLVFLLMNLHYRGMLITAVGFSLNLITIITNKGFMPQDLSKLRLVGEYKKIELLQKYGNFYNATIMSPKTHLNLFADRITIPALKPLIAVYSIGDLIILTGICVFIIEFFKKENTNS